MPANPHKLAIAIAVRYLDAAMVLHKNSPAPNALWEPLNHLFAMSAELALKAFLEASGAAQRELKVPSVRHSLNGLLLLAVDRGLRTNQDVAEVLIEMDEAHSSHAYRYFPRPEEGETATVYSAHPAVAFAAIQQLVDHCGNDPSHVRAATKFPEDWPPASQPVHPVTAQDIESRIADRNSLKVLFGKRAADRG